MSAVVESGPFGAAAHVYRHRGWPGVLPLDPRSKASPPSGFTGHAGVIPSTEQIDYWCSNGQAGGNLALRLPPVVLGIDVDDYGDKCGGQTLSDLERRWGVLPPTFMSTSREDGVSGIRLLRVPPNLSWLGVAGPGIELIHFGHRYVVAPPSVHPEGRVYRWLDPAGVPTELPPLLGDLAELPAAWVQGLSGETLNPVTDRSGVGGVAVGGVADRRAQRWQARQWLSKLPGGPLCVYVAGLLADALGAAGREYGSAHEGTRDAVLGLLRAGETGHRGVPDALAEVRTRFVATVSPDRSGGAAVAGAEFDRFTEDGAALILRDPGERAGRGCDCSRPVIGSATSTNNHERNEVSGLPARDPAMFHGLLGEIVNAVDPFTEADPVGVLVSLLAGVGVVIGPTPHIMIGSTRHPLLVWPVLFGGTGNGRKGEATAAAQRVLLHAEPEAGEFCVTGLSSGEGLIERIQDPVEGDGKRLSRGTSDKRLLVVEPEFSGTLARAKREGSTLAAVLRQTWEGSRLSVLNRESLVASSSHVGVVGHITPREFRLRMAEGDLAGGTYNRFLPVCVERSKRLPLPEPMPARQLEGLAFDLRRRMGQAGKVGAIALGEQAGRLWAGQLYDEFSFTDDAGDQAWMEFTRRAAPYCLRIAALHAALESQRTISQADLDAAAALVRYSLGSARYVLSDQQRDPRLDRIRRAIDEAGPVGLTRTQISGLFSRNLPRDLLDALLAELVTDAHYLATEVPSKGRPSMSYRRAEEVVSS